MRLGIPPPCPIKINSCYEKVALGVGRGETKKKPFFKSYTWQMFYDFKMHYIVTLKLATKIDFYCIIKHH